MHIEIPIEEMQLPDARKLVERMLEPFRLVELVPLGLIDNGYAVSLVPSRAGKTLDVGDKTYLNVYKQTLPTLDLKKAGIETDRRPSTILEEVRKLFENRCFAITPLFNFPATVALGQLIGLGLKVLECKLTLQGGHALLQPFGFDPQKEVDEYLNAYPSFGFEIKPVGDAVPGLEFQPIQGFVGTIVHFLCPWDEVDHDSADYKALQKVVSFYLRKYELGSLDLQFKVYLDANEKKWWFRYFTRTRKRFWRQRRECIDSVRVALAEANKQLAALPA